MPEFDWDRVQRSKNDHRAALVGLPAGEKMEIIERLRDEGLAMRRAHAMRAREPIAVWSIVTSGAAIQLNVLGANPTFVTAVTANINSTAAVENALIRTR